MGKNLSVLLEEDAHGVSDSSSQNSPSSSTTGAQPTQHVSSFLGFSEPMSAEVWTLSRSSARQIDSGHSSSLTNSSSCQQKKQSKGSDITESSFLDSDISKRCVWTGDFLPISRGPISAPFPIENSHLFSHYNVRFSQIKKSKKKKKKIFFFFFFFFFTFLLFLGTTTTYEKQ